MLCSSLVLSALLSLVTGSSLAGSDASSLYSYSQYNVPYQGPPAPLNHDGTVAFTPEFQQANAVHNAAYAEEFKRLQEVESLAEAHPDRTSPPSSSYKEGQYNNQQSSQQYSTHYSYNSASQQPASYTPAVYSPQAHIPAPLNHDGTVAQTPEYNAIAASLHAAHDRALTRHRRSFDHYQGPPAPLNNDGTVALTLEVQQAKAAHDAAVTEEYRRFQEAASLAAAQPDLTSPKQGYSSDNKYNAVQNTQTLSYKYNPESRVPAPLNHDGTVAQTPEYNFAAAAHQAEYQRTLQNIKHQNNVPQVQATSYKYNPDALIPAPLNYDGTVAQTAEYNAAASALRDEYQKSLQSVKHQNNAAQIQGASYKYNPQAVIPAPLNHDGTVAQTAEYNAAATALQAAYQKTLQNVKHQNIAHHY